MPALFRLAPFGPASRDESRLLMQALTLLDVVQGLGYGLM